MSDDKNFYAILFYRFSKILGLAPFSINGNKIFYKSWRDNILPIFHIILFAYGFLNSIIGTDFKWNSIFLTPIIKYVGISISIMTFVCNREMIIKTVDMFFEIAGIFKLLGTVNDYNNICRIRGKIFAVWLTVTMILDIAYSVHLMVFTGQADFTYICDKVIVWNIGTFIYCNLIATFVIVIVFITERFRSMKENLLNIHCSFAQQETSFTSRIRYRVSRQRVSNTPDRLDSELLRKIVLIEKICDLLCDFTDNTMQLFSFPLLIIIADYFVRILFFTYDISTSLYFDIDEINLSWSLLILIGVIAILLRFLELFAIAFVSTKFQVLASEIPALLHAIENEDNSVPLMDEYICPLTLTGSNKTEIILPEGRHLRCDIGKVDVCTFQVVGAVAPQLYRLAIVTNHKACGYDNVQKVPANHMSTMFQQSRLVKGKKLSDSRLRFIYYVAKIFALAPFEIGKNGILFKSSIEILYPIVVAIFCIIFSIFSTIYEIRADYRFGTFIPNVIAVIVANLQNLATVSFLLTSAFRRKDIAEIFNLLIKFEKTFEILGVSQDHRNKRIGTSTCVVIAISMTHIIGQTISIVKRFSDFETEYEENRYKFFEAFQIVFTEWISNVYHIGILILVTVFLYVEKRYRQINETLLKVCASDYGQEADDNRHTNRGSTRIKVRTGDKRSFDASGNVRSIAMSHDILTDVVEKIISLLSIPMVLTICYFSVTATATYYHTLLSSKSYHPTNGSLQSDVLVFIHGSVAIFVFELFYIGRVCYKTQDTANYTTVVLNKVWINYRPGNVKDEVLC